MAIDALLQTLYDAETPAEMWFIPETIHALGCLVRDRVRWLECSHQAKKHGINPYELEQAVKSTLQHASTLPPAETLTALLGADIPAPLTLFSGLLHEGLLILGGKSKRGKSWLMYDLAIAAATGTAAFQHFPSSGAMPVLYLALEDGRGRLQARARAIRPGLQHADNLHLRYSFPLLAHGGAELLQREIEKEGYGLVVIDVLAKLESVGKNGAKNYQETYDMFAPLQAIRRDKPLCIAMLTHLRKSEADDVFDAIMGSAAYQGAQDVLWVLERKPQDDFATLHMRDKDAEDKTLAIRFCEGHWEYMGEGEIYEIDRDQRKVVEILSEEKRLMTIPEVMKAMDAPESRYGYFRKLFMHMVKDDLIHRAQQGKYSATVLGYPAEPF
jgi:RecA-family ATPase